jgi:hypothetical protein
MVLSNPSYHDIPTDESTLYRWNEWFKSSLDYWVGCLIFIMLQTKQENVPLDLRSVSPETSLHRLGRLVWATPPDGWLELSGPLKYKFMVTYPFCTFVRRGLIYTHDKHIEWSVIMRNNKKVEDTTVQRFQLIAPLLEGFGGLKPKAKNAQTKSEAIPSHLLEQAILLREGSTES